MKILLIICLLSSLISADEGPDFSANTNKETKISNVFDAEKGSVEPDSIRNFGLEIAALKKQCALKIKTGTDFQKLNSVKVASILGMQDLWREMVPNIHLRYEITYPSGNPLEISAEVYPFYGALRLFYSKEVEDHLLSLLGDKTVSEEKKRFYRALIEENK